MEYVTRKEFEAFKDEMISDMKELKQDQKALLRFMYRMEGGKAWAFGLWTFAATLGGLIITTLTYYFK